MTQYMKAIFATVTAGLGAAATALADGTITPLEGVVIAATAIAAGGAVYGIPNSTPTVRNDHRA